MHRFGRALCTLKLPGTQKPYAEQIPGPMWSGQAMITRSAVEPVVQA
jgi:hypothetical protein